MVIERVRPEIDCGRFPIKRVIAEKVIVEADAFADGHDAITCELLYRAEDDAEWRRSLMQPLVNDRWRGEFSVTGMGRYLYTIEGWIDHFATWRRDLTKRIAAGQDVSVDLLIGAAYVEDAALRASSDDAERLRLWASMIRDEGETDARAAAALGADLAAMMQRHPDRRFASRYERELRVIVDPVKARFSAWYELFPRSCGSLRGVEAWLPYVESMGFDVLYLPPIHPIGRTYRKGRNNSLTPQPGDPGSPWAIGSEEGGHKSIDPELGTLDDFRHLVAAAREHGLNIALDIAFQCSPDHPWVREHPEWFHKRPDGTIQYAENPPKKYQDIYPLNFETPHWQSLWEELESVFLFWIEQGVHIFRVDNPHTKAFGFWEWAIGEIKLRYPDVLFLAEAFTRPKVMYRLAKLGFSQSYTYFAWRNAKDELIDYFRELTQTEVREYFRPNLWPNTPDILTEFLQSGGRPAFMVRLVLAATLGASYGIYGAAFELLENHPREPGSEEYLNSEKYEVKHWPVSAPSSLKDFIANVNRIRRENLPLHSNATLHFHATDNPFIICYSKTTDDLSGAMIMAVNLDPFREQWGWVTLDLDAIGLSAGQAFAVDDLLGGARYMWSGARNFVKLIPETLPAHVLRVQRATI